ISAWLRERLSPKTKTLLAGFDDHEGPTEELRLALVEELNGAIDDNFFYAPLSAAPGSKDKGEVDESDKDSAALSLRINRSLLDEAYSYEIKDMFPPREKLESERPRSASPEPGRKVVEGSSSAWRDPVHHLRLFASYLTPRKGMLSADTWRAVSVVTRNLALTWLILLPVLIAIVMAGQLILRGMSAISGEAAELEASPDLVAWGRFKFLCIIVAVLVAFIVLMSVLWLFFSAEKFTVNGFVIQLLCLGAVGTLVYAGLTIHPPLKNRLTEWWAEPRVKIGVEIWGGVALILLWRVLRLPGGSELPGDRLESSGEWKREARRNKISRIHTGLMIILAVVSVVLLFAGFGYWFLYRLFAWDVGSSLKFPVALLPLLSALGGSLFTAFKSTPTGGGDQLRVRKPSAITRFIFAVTPGLLVAVLAVGAAWLGDVLLDHINGEATSGTVALPLTLAIFNGVLLCFALAVYEMNWETPPVSWGAILFSCLVAFNSAWAAFSVTTYFKSQSRGWIIAIPFAVWVGVLIIAFTRMFGNGKWRLLLEKAKNYHGTPQRLFAQILIGAGIAAVLVVSWVIGTEPLSHDIAVLLAALAGLTGGILLFRLAVVRKGAARTFDLPKPLKASPIGRRHNCLWWFASLCLAVTILAVGLLHLPLSNGNVADESRARDIAVTLLLAALGAVLPHALIRLRKLVVLTEGQGTKEKAVGGESVEPKPEAKQGWIEWALSHIPGVKKQPQATFRVIAAYAVASGVATGFTIQGLSQVSSMRQSLWMPFSLPVLLIAFVGSVVLLEVAVARMPVEAAADEERDAGPWGRKWVKEHSELLLWLLAGGCILIALLIGFLSKLSLTHLGKNSSEAGRLSELALPGLIACFTIMVFEMWMGKGDNRRSLWLLGAAYAVLAVLFVIGLLVPTVTANKPVMVLLTALGLLAGLMVWIIALGWMVDPNAVSMHQFYKGRLVRAYLGASNVRRFNERKEITEAVAGDDVPLAKLKNCQRGAPYHLINTTLNLVAGRDLTTAQRSAASFVLAQNYCGSSRTLYRQTWQYMSGRLTLGAAVAASGAAVSPSMGAKKPTAALAMLMTLLNVRLGYWAPTPNHENWMQAQPRLWPFYLLREFLSQTNDLSSYCYLTDGGHFDNTGLYSLVERGCRYIVMADCGADPQPCFEDLGDVIRRCRIDFGTEIDLDIEPFLKGSAQGQEQQFVVGTIKYSRKHASAFGWNIKGRDNSDEERRARTGIIIYFKPKVSEIATADVRQYAIENKHFPHQSTTNQWFGEAQFESYRRLGQTCAEKAFRGLDATSQIQNRTALCAEHVEALFLEAEKKFNPEKRTSSAATA
ncbi:MAG TPA: hypothetical protein VJT74_12865, partial [Pyrinomonadaceae bacterium]|nr:hypothetical protein [Pyrinomonadaceae bacterium]